MIGIMNGKPPGMLFLPNDFLPAKKKLIDERYGYKMWTYAVHFDRSLPDKNPDDVEVEGNRPSGTTFSCHWLKYLLLK